MRIILGVLLIGYLGLTGASAQCNPPLRTECVNTALFLLEDFVRRQFDEQQRQIKNLREIQEQQQQQIKLLRQEIEEQKRRIHEQTHQLLLLSNR